VRGYKIRSFPEKNYRSIYINGKTLRLRYDDSKPIEELDFPEFYDVKITEKCNGKCLWCYQDSNPGDKHYMDALKKIDLFFGAMTNNQKPYQVAIGGGEPTMHPNFVDILEKFHNLGITPNYTTNGMHYSNKLLEATKNYCGGVAVSCHDHLYGYWSNFARIMAHEEVHTNLHLIISDKDSIDSFTRTFIEFEDKINYFVLLPHAAQGRAVSKELGIKYLINRLRELESTKIAFGALFYPYLAEYKDEFSLSLYEPEIMSKYLDLGNMQLYKSSFNC